MRQAAHDEPRNRDRAERVGGDNRGSVVQHVISPRGHTASRLFPRAGRGIGHGARLGQRAAHQVDRAQAGERLHVGPLPRIAVGLHHGRSARMGDGQAARSRPAWLSLPPVGPAMPVMPTPTSTPARRRTPSAIATATDLAHRAVRGDVRPAHAEQRDLGRVAVGDDGALDPYAELPGMSVSRDVTRPPVHDSATAIFQPRASEQRADHRFDGSPVGADHVRAEDAGHFVDAALERTRGRRRVGARAYSCSSSCPAEARIVASIGTSRSAQARYSGCRRSSACDSPRPATSTVRMCTRVAGARAASGPAAASRASA